MKGLRQGGLPGEEYEKAGRDIEEGIQAAKILVKAGYDALNVDAGTYDSWYWNHPPMYFEKEGVYCEFGEILKKEVDVPIILAGRMENPELAVNEIGKSCDIVEYGRQLLTDPYYPEKVRTDRLDEIRPCLGCHEGCLGRGGKAPISCAVNPECGREEVYKITRADTEKQVLVIGGGIAGCETARICAKRGHKVVLCEKSDQLGGNLVPGGVPSFKNYDRKLVEWYARQLELLNVQVRLQTEMTEKDIKESNADVIVIATGSVPIYLKQDELKAAVPADEVLLGKVEPGNTIAIETPEGEKILPADTVITSLGYKSENRLYEDLKFINKPIYNVGDSKQVHNIMYAIWDAYEVARNI